MTTPNDDVQELVADVVVVGSGAAGCVAALRAAAEGDEVVVLEAAAKPGGTTARSAGGIWIANNSCMRARGLEDPREDCLRYMAYLSYPDQYDPASETFGLDQRDFDMLAVVYDRGSEAIDWLVDNGHLSVMEMNGFTGTPGDHPPAHEVPEIDRAPYGRHLASSYNTEGVKALEEGPAWRGLGSVPGVDTPGDGAELSRQLVASLARKGVALLVEHRVNGMLTDADEVVGVTAETPAGLVNVRARKGVVFASGGFSPNADLSDRFLKGPIYGTGAAPTCQGDFVILAEGLGAELGNMGNAWWCQVPLEAALQARVMNWLIFWPWGDSMIIVNHEGKRVVNEKAYYSERGPAHFIGGAEEGWPNRILCMIYDEGVASRDLDWAPRWPVPLPEGKLGISADGIDERALVISGETLEELTANIEARLESLADRTDGFALDPGFADALRDTIERFNGYAALSKDLEFHRGEDRLQREVDGGPRPGNDKNPAMFPFRKTGPYHCILLTAGTLDTKGGPRIDHDARVLLPDGTPIPRLYGAGNCIANPTVDAYWSGGATLGTAIPFGYIAGSAVVQESKRELTDELRAVRHA